MKKKIFITGGHGFLGKQVYLKLKKSGYNNQLRLEIYSNEYLEWLKYLKS